MFFFKKKKPENEYNKALESLNQEPVLKASERIVFDQISGDDQNTVKLVEQLMKHNPLVVNFDKVDVPTANKVLAFIAGAVYALRGKTIKIDEKTYLFALSEEFLDNSLDEFIRSLT